jgi:hypothetical protein
MTKKEWSHLPNAEHIDWVLETLEENLDVGDAAWGAAREAAWKAMWDASRAAAWVAAMGGVWDASRVGAWDAAFGAIAALIAWDDSSKFLDMSVEEVKGLAREGNHAAVLLLPAVIVKHKLKELEND